MNINESPLRIIHWEYNPSGTSEISKEPELNLYTGNIRHNETNQSTGFYFRWVCRLFSNNGLIVGCTGEQGFRMNDLTKVTPQILIEFSEKSFNNFRNDFYFRLKQTNYMCIIEFQLSQEKAVNILIELNRE